MALGATLNKAGLYLARRGQCVQTDHVRNCSFLKEARGPVSKDKIPQCADTDLDCLAGRKGRGSRELREAVPVAFMLVPAFV